MSGVAASAGGAVRNASWAGTALFAATAAAAAVWPPTFGAPALAVAVALFVGGCATFLWAFVLVAARSRTDQMDLAQIWFLGGPPTPSNVRRSLRGALAAQVVVGLATAGVRPYTSLAAGVLVPMWGLSLCGLWAARHGEFPPGPPDTRRLGPGLRSTNADRREQNP
ncbi:MAG: hypothetical protein ACR2HM_05045 [Acidimicrobiales bacterium]